MRRHDACVSLCFVCSACPLACVFLAARCCLAPDALLVPACRLSFVCSLSSRSARSDPADPVERPSLVLSPHPALVLVRAFARARLDACPLPHHERTCISRHTLPCLVLRLCVSPCLLALPRGPMPGPRPPSPTMFSPPQASAARCAFCVPWHKPTAAQAAAAPWAGTCRPFATPQTARPCAQLASLGCRGLGRGPRPRPPPAPKVRLTAPSRW